MVVAPPKVDASEKPPTMRQKPSTCTSISIEYPAVRIGASRSPAPLILPARSIMPRVALAAAKAKKPIRSSSKRPSRASWLATAKNARMPNAK